MGTFNDPCRMCQVMPYRCGAVLPAPLLQVLLCPRWPWKFESKKSQCVERRYMAQYLEMAVRRPLPGMWRLDLEMFLPKVSWC